MSTLSGFNDVASLRILSEVLVQKQRAYYFIVWYAPISEGYYAVVLGYADLNLNDQSNKEIERDNEISCREHENVGEGEKAVCLPDTDYQI